MATTRYKLTNLAALATTTIKSGTGYLHAITINTAGATGNTIVVYDNTAASGTIIASINGLTPAGSTLLFDGQFVTGLTVILATGTAADITLSWE